MSSTATIATSEHTSVPDLRPLTASAAATPPEPMGFGRSIALFVPATIAAVFVLAVITIASRTNTTAATVGYAAFLSFWLGGGGGFLAAGIHWGLGQEAAQHAERGPRP